MSTGITQECPRCKLNKDIKDFEYMGDGEIHDVCAHCYFTAGIHE